LCEDLIITSLGKLCWILLSSLTR